MKKCELCRLPASLYCESDEASLCAECDLKVHEVNFLVARHSRRLLCKRCQRLTPWAACGARLGNTVTACDKCAVEAFDDEEEESEGENQVVPVTASSTGDTSSFLSSVCASRSKPSVKRMRECDDVADHNRRQNSAVSARQQFGGDKLK